MNFICALLLLRAGTFRFTKYILIICHDLPVTDCKECRDLVHTWIIEFHAAISARLQWYFGPTSHALVAYHLERGVMPLRDAVAVNYKVCVTTDIKAQVNRIWAKECVLDMMRA